MAGNAILARYSGAVTKAHNKIIGHRIREARRRRRAHGLDYTQEWLAEQLGLTRNAVGFYERGERAVDVEMLGRLARVLECDPLWLGALDDLLKPSQQETTLLELYRRTDDRGREAIYRIAETQPGYADGKTHEAEPPASVDRRARNE